jgi:hypothetical protein
MVVALGRAAGGVEDFEGDLNLGGPKDPRGGE